MNRHPDTHPGEAKRIEPLLSMREVQAILGVSRSTVYSLMRRGELTPVRFSPGPKATNRFRPADVLGLIERGRRAP